jgi:hypothetical protein
MSTLAFLIFGALLARSLTPEPEAMVVMGVAFAIGGALATGLLRALLIAAAGPARESPGSERLDRANRKALAVLLPFAVLAGLADFVLGWQSTLAFLAAGVSGMAAAAAAAQARLGAPALRAAVLAALWALALLAGTTLTLPVLAIGLAGGTG